MNSVRSIKLSLKYKYHRFTQSGFQVIEIGKYSDVYNIYDVVTNNYQGILYIKGIKQSKEMKRLLLNKDKIKLQCKFNNDFKKWEPVI